MAIKRLTETIINQIAAGEVIERPASVVKELVENAIDAGATRVDVVTAGGGKNLIRVTDNGSGMGRDDVLLAVERHCTSKLSDDLLDIRTLGFRGEALPSIGAVSKLSITTRAIHSDHAWGISVNGGELEGPIPAALTQGTIIEVRDLFYATPARLKFLKTDRAEDNPITEIFKRIALAFPNVRFSLSGSERGSLDYPAIDGDDALLRRSEQVLGKGFSENALAIDAERETARLFGYAALPTFNRGNAQHQFVFVNGRPVKDRSLNGAIRGAYSDFLARDRHAVLVLFIETEPHQVDVNVHPAKADVRFRDPGMIRGLIVGALREAITGAGHRASTHSGADMANAFRAGSSAAYRENGSAGHYTSPGNANYDYRTSHERPHEFSDAQNGFAENGQARFETGQAYSADLRANETPTDTGGQSLPLGAPRAQLHKNYIISQTQDGLVIVDQHAAHERLVYEAMKAALEAKGIASQMLLIPEVVELPEEDADRLMAHAETLMRLGLSIEKFGPGAVAVTETPAMLGEVDAGSLVRDLVDEIAEWGSADLLKDKLDYVSATMACHGSVRSGRILKGAEMDALLREMEATPNSGQCNHGRPTYVELKLNDIERLFGRR